MISFSARQKNRAFNLSLILLLAAFSVGLIAYALSKNINLYYTPTEIALGKAALDQRIRLGGLIKKRTVKYDKKTLGVHFQVTDLNNTVRIDYHGILPDLFAEGRGVIVEGHLVKKQILLADKVLAKHDEKYMPKEVRKTLNTKQLLI